jgi:hypothetical protein
VIVRHDRSQKLIQANNEIDKLMSVRAMSPANKPMEEVKHGNDEEGDDNSRDKELLTARKRTIP